MLGPLSSALSDRAITTLRSHIGDYLLATAKEDAELYIISEAIRRRLYPQQSPTDLDALVAYNAGLPTPPDIEEIGKNISKAVLALIALPLSDEGRTKTEDEEKIKRALQKSFEVFISRNCDTLAWKNYCDEYVDIVSRMSSSLPVQIINRLPFLSETNGKKVSFLTSAKKNVFEHSPQQLTLSLINNFDSVWADLTQAFMRASSHPTLPNIYGLNL